MSIPPVHTVVRTILRLGPLVVRDHMAVVQQSGSDLKLCKRVRYEFYFNWPKFNNPLSDIGKKIQRLALSMAKIEYVEITYGQSISIDQEKEIIEILKRRQFVETIEKGWVRGFVRVVVTKQSVHIGHDVKGNKLTVVQNPLLSLDEFINYFSRI